MVILEPAVKTFVFAAIILHVSWSVLAQTPKVQTGIERLRHRNFDILNGNRVGLITNPTGVDSHLKSTVDILHEAQEVQLMALFGPEHGVRGDAPGGQTVDSYTDPQTGLPVFSLYGKTRKPTAEMLKNIDVLVYDIQDIGCRSYSYISTMGLAMEAAAENRIPFVVLDRPNPLGGIKVEGNLMEKGFESFVGRYPIPYVYGLTCGELARLLNGERLLADSVTCKLTVVPMKGWKRSMTFSQTGLPWVPPSPHVPSELTPQYYVGSGVLGELGVLSEGVGYTIPFQTFAAEWIDQKVLAEKLNALNLVGVLFRPIEFKPFYGKFKDKDLKGVQIYITDYGKVHLMSLQFVVMEVHNGLYPEKNPFTLADSSSIQMFDRVVGTDKLREMFTKRMVYADIQPYLEKDVDKFKEKAKKYYLYK
jgi:uncharacterized protein YbbC (DUF1343 family)